MQLSLPYVGSELHDGPARPAAEWLRFWGGDRPTTQNKPLSREGSQNISKLRNNSWYYVCRVLELRETVPHYVLRKQGDGWGKPAANIAKRNICNLKYTVLGHQSRSPNWQMMEWDKMGSCCLLSPPRLIQSSFTSRRIIASLPSSAIK